LGWVFCWSKGFLRDGKISVPNMANTIPLQGHSLRRAAKLVSDYILSLSAQYYKCCAWTNPSCVEKSLCWKIITVIEMHCLSWSSELFANMIKRHYLSLSRYMLLKTQIETFILDVRSHRLGLLKLQWSWKSCMVAWQ
jgi:hypothetical protein